MAPFCTHSVLAVTVSLALPSTENVVLWRFFVNIVLFSSQFQALADAMTGISNSAKQGELDHFCDAVRNFANAVCGLTENSAQTAYLVGIADPTSEPGRPGLVDQSQYARANQAIQMACQSLSDPATSQQQVLNAATIIAKQTSALCNSCRVASSKTSNAVAKRHFVQSAKDVANNTAALVRAIKALDGDFSDDNRKKCAEAARPLLQSVDELTTYASSPEFASIPAKISLKGRQAQEAILTADRGLIDGACNMIQSAKQLAVNPRDPPTYQQYSAHSHGVSESIKKLVTSIRESAPGQKECERALERINSSMHQLDQASLSAVGQSLRPLEGKTLQGYQDQVINSTKQMLDLVHAIRCAAKAEPENLGHLVSSLASYLEPMADGSIGCASKTVNSRQQMNILDQSKTATEAAAQLIVTAKEAGGNPKALHTHKNVDEAAEGASEMLQELLLTMEDSASAAGYTSAMIDNISKSMALVDERGVLNENLSYVDYQTNMVALARKIARNAHDMNVKSSSNVEGLGALANLLTRDYNQLSQDSKGAIALCSNQDISNRIKIAVQDLGTSCIDLVKDAGNLQVNPTDGFSKRELQEHARKVTERVTNVLAALQAGSRGTQACINAASTVSGIIGDLDTTIMFATAGTLNPEGDESFANHRENILKTAKALVEDTKTLVTGAASNQEQLANAAQSAVMTITRLADCVKMGAASLGSEQPEAQVLLINAVKDVASALGELISATKNASGKTAQDPAMSMLKDSAKVMVTNVTSLLKTVKTVEDEAARGTRALESSIEAIGQELRNYVATDHVEKRMTPEELIRHTKPITIATGKAVAAGNSGKQEDVIVAANMGRKAVFDLLKACKGASLGAETPDVRHRVVDSGRFCSESYKDLLEHVNNVIQHPSVENKQKLASLSKRVATAVTEIVQAAEVLKGTDWVDPHDPTVIAESELLSAANAIEAAAKKLTQLKPRVQPKQVNENLNFEEQILEAAKSIAAATAALVKAASAAQRELIAQGKIGQFSSEQEEDSQWSQGLISAARLVAVAVQSLCEAANAMVQGHGSEEKLISSAKQVASSTAQLLVACKVKADAESPAMRRLQLLKTPQNLKLIIVIVLQAAGNAVKRATEALVRAAQQVKDGWDQPDGDFMVNDRMVGGIAQMITAQEEILIKEKELEQARRKLENIRRAKYKDRPPGDDSGTEF
ncbi:hypothetical protein LSH36_379g01080 [Paralvinella palmiformis]|uniref:I/LWEQ domain-containing protein n=1 Tax=Paralvinella palmiformis TaxID=53620 RepID=A0AAD9N0Z1_9ANNE|nr:hypothetical protein LSH36_379g01080 [Paralvinella palmiformis]